MKDITMKLTTKLAIFLVICGIALNIIATFVAPNNLAGFDLRSVSAFESAINAANAFKKFGIICFIIAIICGGVSLYNNIMNKPISKVIHGHNIENSPGVAFATHDSTAIAGGSALARGSSKLNFQGSTNIHNQLTIVSDFIQNSRIDADHKRRAKLLLSELQREAEGPNSGTDRSDAKFHFRDLIDIVKIVGQLTPAAADALGALRKIYGS